MKNRKAYAIICWIVAAMAFLAALLISEGKIENVTKEYKKNKKVIDNLNLEIKDGEIFGFLGPNGAGKTTTIKLMTGILEINKGEILIDNKSFTKEPIEAKK